MTEIDNDWLATPTTDEVATDPAPPSVPSPAPSRRTMAVRAALVAAGAVVGGVVVASVHQGATASTSPTAFGTTQLPGGTFQGGPPNGIGGGLAGEQRLSGTLVSVGSSTVTVRTSSGTATYLVTSSTQIIRNGQVVGLSALQAGDPVFVHVYSSGTSSKLTVERLFAGLTGTSQEGLSSRPADGPNLGA